MAVPRAPPKIVQQSLFENALSVQQFSTGTFQWEYGVSKEWMKEYKTKLSDQNVKAVEMRPLYLSMSEFENTFIPEAVWKILLSWYGLADDSVFLRRPNYSQLFCVNLPSGTENIFVDNMLDLVSISVGRLDQLQCPEQFCFIQVLFWEQISFLEMIARRLLKIPPSSGVRMWLSLSQMGSEISVKCIDQALYIMLGSLVCAENKLLLDTLRQRQNFFVQEQQASTGLVQQQEMNMSLNKVLDQQGLVIKICLEELPPKMAGSSAYDQENAFFGEIAPFVHSSAKSDSDWNVALNEAFQQLAVDVNESIMKQTRVLGDQAEMIVGSRLAKLEKKEEELKVLDESLKAKKIKLDNKESDLKEKEAEFERNMSKYRQSLTDFLTKKKKLEEDLKRVEDQNKISEQKIDLSIGGLKFTTSVVTMTREKDSIFDAMFSGRNSVHREKDGSFFIDRDGTHFRYILNYLRDGKQAVESFPTDVAILKELLTEAKYYNLPPLINALNSKVQAGSKLNK